MTLHMLTTVDNPFNPETQWDDWFAFDSQAGYNSPALLARVAITSDELSDTDQDIAREEAIDAIIRENPDGVYKKVQIKNED